MSQPEAKQPHGVQLLGKEGPTTNSESVAQAVLKNRERYMRYQTFRDTDGVMTCWSNPNSVLLPPGQAVQIGWDVVKKWYTEQLKVTELALQVVYDQILGAHENADEPGNWAFARATYSGVIYILQPDGTMETVEDHGKILESHCRDKDGLWRFTTHMWSSDIAANTDAQQHHAH